MGGEMLTKHPQEGTAQSIKCLFCKNFDNCKAVQLTLLKTFDLIFGTWVSIADIHN